MDNLVNSSETFAKIVIKNLPKRQLKICQSSNFGFNKTRLSFNAKPSPCVNKNKENILLKIFQNYSSKISPLTEKESLFLKDILKNYNPETVEKAITIVSSGNDKSFSYFLKVLDDLAIKNRRQAIRLTGFESMESILKRLNNS